MRRFWLTAAVPVLMASAVAVSAQTPLPVHPVSARLGFVAEMSRAKLGGEDLNGDVGYKNGFNGGVYVALSVLGFQVQPELLYVSKGARTADGGDWFELRTRYIEVPVLARVNLLPLSPIRPQLYFGPSIAYQVGCSAAWREAGLSDSAACDDGTVDEEIEIADVDYGVIGGVGLAFGLGGRQATVGARYEYGLKNVGVGESKNRMLSFFASVEFPLLGR